MPARMMTLRFYVAKFLNLQLWGRDCMPACTLTLRFDVGAVRPTALGMALKELSSLHPIVWVLSPSPLLPFSEWLILVSLVEWAPARVL